MRKIKTLDCSKEFTRRNFTLSDYIDDTGRKLPMHEMTKDGFMFLVMGFTGKKAAAIKESYINAFNQMHEKLFPAAANITEPPTISKAQQGMLFSLVTDHSESSGKPRAYFWKCFQKHFKLNSYKNLPADRFSEGVEFLKTLDGALPSKAMPGFLNEANYKTAMLLISRIRGFAAFAVPNSHLHALNADITQLEYCLRQARIDMTEALFNMNDAARFLQRWLSQ